MLHRLPTSRPRYWSEQLLDPITTRVEEMFEYTRPIEVPEEDTSDHLLLLMFAAVFVLVIMNKERVLEIFSGGIFG